MSLADSISFPIGYILGSLESGRDSTAHSSRAARRRLTWRRPGWEANELRLGLKEVHGEPLPRLLAGRNRLNRLFRQAEIVEYDNHDHNGIEFEHFLVIDIWGI